MRLLLGAKAKDPTTALQQIVLPCFASYKYDGWRGFWQGLEFFSRNAKTIPNRALQQTARKYDVPPGWDGEIIIGDPYGPGVFDRTNTFCKTLAAPIPQEGIRFLVFDNALASGGFSARQATIFDIPPFVEVVDQRLIETFEQLEAFEAEAVALGYEGICTRAIYGPYKHGRSTMNEQYLVKVKRYIDEEMEIIGFEERLHNANPAFISETGYTKRSSHAEGKVPAGTLGKVLVNWRGKVLRVGSGWDSHLADEIWRNQAKYLGQKPTIRYSPPTKDLPRQPIWKGIRGDK